VGDSIPADTAAALESFVKGGGRVVATAGVGRYGAYREANPKLQDLMGLASRKLEERETFIRPLQEMQFLKPMGTVTGEGWEFPVLSLQEEIKPAKEVEVLATRKDGGQPVLIGRNVGKGRILYMAALPGVAYLWSALQPPVVPDRGVNTHKVPVRFDTGVTTWVEGLLAEAGIEPPVLAEGRRVDARLVKAGKTVVLPIAHFNETVGQDVAFSLKLEGTVKSVTSAYRGELKSTVEGGRVVFTVPKLGYGDLVRIDLK